VHRDHDLPASIAEQCVRLTQSFNLRFSAIDLVLDVEGEYWFLEMNPNGQWAWVESRVGLPISETIVDELETISNA
jgi:D-alanine-D-alanine ligase-like ATP-grasp enzyme